MDFLQIDHLLKEALLEDLGRGDITTDAILHDKPASARARVIAREEIVLAGWPVFARVFDLLGPVQSKSCFQEGESLAPGNIGTIEGDASVLLKGERVALNCLQRLCAIATHTRRYVRMVAHTNAKVLDTRKTTPLWRMLEKYAVRIGGGQNHRLGLDDGVLIKENHVAVAGSMKAAFQACQKQLRHLHKIEVEVQTLEQLREAVSLGADIVLLDNMDLERVREAVRIAAGRCLLEVSGGVNERNIVAYAEAGVDYISSGALTHSFRSPDISLLIE